MVKPLPDNVKECLAGLTAAQQVILRGYIGTMRAEVKELEEKIRGLEHPDPDAHAHFHGDEKCTADHGHADAEHAHHHGHEKCTEDHDHKNEHEHKQEHKHAEHKEHKHAEHNEHKHEHHEHKDEHHEHKHEHHEHKHEHHEPKKEPDHGHDHEHEHHEHKHDHTKKEEEIPAWKKRAMESGNDDPMAAPFGGNWNTESSLSAKDTKMEE